VGYEAQLVSTDGTQYQSSGWSTLLDANQPAIMRHVAAGGTATAWPKGYQAQIEVNIPKIAVDNYRAPYVSVWVTDANKKLVRTIAVWGRMKNGSTLTMFGGAVMAVKCQTWMRWRSPHVNLVNINWPGMARMNRARQ
jgi:hypothetical protein